MGGTQLKRMAVRVGGVGRWGGKHCGVWLGEAQLHTAGQVSGAMLGMDRAVQTDMAVLG